jgi:hypothetical protein
MYCLTEAESIFVHCEPATTGLTVAEAFMFYNPLDELSTIPLYPGYQVGARRAWQAMLLPFLLS